MKLKRCRKWLAMFCVLLFAVGTVVPAYAATSSFDSAYADASFKMFSKVTKQGTNVLISPVSVMTAVSMAENGAYGKTRTEMETVFDGLSTSKTTNGLSNMINRLSGESKYYIFRSPCSIWYNKKYLKLSSSYKNKMMKAYSAKVSALSASNGAAKINEWVSNATNKKIKSIINSIDPSMAAILVNASYFKGEWSEPYSGSVNYKFTYSDGSSKKVPMLEGTESEYIAFKGATGFVKRYMGGKVSFVAILPPKGTTPEQFVKQVSGKDFLKAYRNRKTSNVTVRTRLPKFKYTFSKSLKKSLQCLGMKSAFLRSADFRSMGQGDVYINDVLHKTYISLDEKGTEAAGVTAVMMAACCMPPETMEYKNVYLNRPFIYEIVETSTGNPLFIGIVNKP